AVDARGAHLAPAGPDERSRTCAPEPEDPGNEGRGAVCSATRRAHDPRTREVSNLEFIDARSLDDALTFLAQRGDETTVLAGGTDVVVALLAGELTSKALLHVRRVPELHGIDTGERTRIGAATTHWTLASDSRIRTEHPAVAEAALTVGGRQTQNVG